MAILINRDKPSLPQQVQINKQNIEKLNDSSIGKEEIEDLTKEVENVKVATENNTINIGVAETDISELKNKVNNNEASINNNSHLIAQETEDRVNDISSLQTQVNSVKNGLNKKQSKLVVGEQDVQFDARDSNRYVKLYEATEWITDHLDLTQGNMVIAYAYNDNISAYNSGKFYVPLKFVSNEYGNMLAFDEIIDDTEVATYNINFANPQWDTYINDEAEGFCHIVIKIIKLL